jgi:CHAT domain-containing protein
VQDFALTYVASATRWAQLTRLARSRPRREVSDALVVGPPVVSPSSREARERSRRTWQTYELEGLSAESLPDAGLEAQAVARHGGPGSVVVVGAEASESWLEQQDLSRYGVLHFATHSVLSVQSPARSALLLDGDETEDGFLQAREISQLRLAADLVVLSSCRTVQRPEIGSDGGQGIADSFLQAGATSVVASLWAVKDRDAADFMSTFYDHLAAGYSKAEALRRAKLDELARDPRSHPSRWAAFILLGEGHRDLHLLPRKPRRPWKWAGLATVVILVLGAAGRLRSRPPRPRSR